VQQRRAFLATKEVERCKPHFAETQIMVGELLQRKWTEEQTGLFIL